MSLKDAALSEGGRVMMCLEQANPRGQEAEQWRPGLEDGWVGWGITANGHGVSFCGHGTAFGP